MDGSQTTAEQRPRMRDSAFSTELRCGFLPHSTAQLALQQAAFQA